LKTLTRKIVFAGILTALTFVVTIFTRIPFPLTQGYFNLGDSVVFIAAILFGGCVGAVSGAVGSALADVILGSLIFVPVTFVVKGLAGYVTGKLCERGFQYGGARLYAALCVGLALIVGGYFVVEATILSLYDSVFGMSAAIAELPVNLVQGILSALVSRAVIAGLKRSKWRFYG
jgi:uncharacterized membrane protein